MPCPTEIRMEWQGNALFLSFFLTQKGKKKDIIYVIFLNYKMPVFNSPSHKPWYKYLMLLYWLALLGLYFLCRTPVEHQMLNTSTCSNFAIPAHITHLILFVGGHVGRPTHWQVNSLIWTMSQWKRGCYFILAHLCQHHCRGKKKKGYEWYTDRYQLNN